MIKQLNRILKLVGFNLVRAKSRRKVKWTGRLTISTAGPEIDSPLLPKCSDGNTKLSDYMGQSEWQNTPPVAVPVPNPGKTHYVGDDCPGGHKDCFKSLTQVGVDDHEMTRVEQPNSDNKVTGPTS